MRTKNSTLMKRRGRVKRRVVKRRTVTVTANSDSWQDASDSEDSNGVSTTEEDPGLTTDTTISLPTTPDVESPIMRGSDRLPDTEQAEFNDVIQTPVKEKNSTEFRKTETVIMRHASTSTRRRKKKNSLGSKKRPLPKPRGDRKLQEDSNLKDLSGSKKSSRKKLQLRKGSRIEPAEQETNYAPKTSQARLDLFLVETRSQAVNETGEKSTARESEEKLAPVVRNVKPVPLAVVDSLRSMGFTTRLFRDNTMFPAEIEQALKDEKKKKKSLLRRLRGIFTCCLKPKEE